MARKGRGRGRGAAKGPRGGAKHVLVEDEPQALPSLIVKLKIDYSRLHGPVNQPVQSHPITPPPSHPDSPSNPDFLMAPGPQEELEGRNFRCL